MQVVKIDIPHMEEYLLSAIQAEKYVYIWQNAYNKAQRELNAIQDSIRINTNSINSSQNFLVNKNTIEDDYQKMDLITSRQYKRKSNVFLLLFFVIALICYVGSAIGLKKAGFDFTLWIILTIAVGTLVTVTSVIAPVFLILGIKNRMKSNEYKSRSKQTLNVDTQIKQLELQRSNGNLIVLKNKEEALIGEFNNIQTNLVHSKQTLASIYSKNILAREYRNLDAVSKMYSYLTSGRCDQIYGHGGMLDTYIKDRQWEINAQQLFSLNKTVSAIRDVQDSMYDEIRETNRSLASINNQLDKIKNSNYEIEKNSAISAVANQQAAAELAWQSREMYYNRF